jgi:hypothetical protein
MRKLILLAALLPLTVLADPPWDRGNGGDADATAIAAASADADARASATNFTSVSSQQAQGQLQGQLQGQVANGGDGGNATSYGSSATTGASTSSALAGGGISYAVVGDTTANAAPSTSSATGGSVGNTTATSGDATVGNVAASVGAVVESGAVQSSTNVTTNYREASQGVAIVLTTACGTAASGSGRSFTFGAAQGQDAFCKNLALAKVYFDLQMNDEGMKYVTEAAKLVKVDNFFDQITTVLTLGILK